MTFSDFIKSLDVDPAQRGKQFEHFVKWFLKADPEWSTQVEQVWLWDEWPGRWGADCGIDLVFLHKNGENWAVQAKCYSPEHHITKHDVDKFLSESNRKGIEKRLLIGTTDNIGKNAVQVCEAQDKAVTRFLLSDFIRAEVEYPASYDDLHKAKRREPPPPRPHQIEAIQAVADNFQAAERGQLIMACGTGKTYTTLWIKEKLKSNRTLVLLPSLSLLSQTLREWTLAANQPFDVLCVCSDETVGKRGEDEAIHSVSELAFPVTSDAVGIQRFLEGAGAKVIFSTYQSSPLVAEAQVNGSIPAFDLVIADEAHRCTGKVSSDFATVLDGDRIRATKRLFATATPRTYTPSVKKAAEERGVEVVGMDDEAVFGKVLYSLSFGEAIRRNLLTDYRVVIIGVDNPMIAAWIENREIVATESGIENDAESLAAQIGLLKAIKDYDLKRMISFHSRVSRAEAFNEDLHKVISWIGAEHRPSGELWTDYVSGAMPADKRRHKLDHLKAIGQNQRGLLTNARCLSEGVDVPSLDGVAFIDPRSSQVDIIQAVGRAIRLSKDKVAGTIVLPVFIEQGADAISSIEASNFKPVWDVLNALKSHDEELSQQLDSIRTELGRRSGSKADPEALTKIAIDLPSTVDQSFGDSLRTYLVERSTESWNFWYGLLQEHLENNSNSCPPPNFVTPNGQKLGQWVSEQRKRKKHNKLSMERQSRLDALPSWTWKPFETLWEEGFYHLSSYLTQVGDANVPVAQVTNDGFRLGIWVHNQRHKTNLQPELKRRLEALPGWKWEALNEVWQENFHKLKGFVTINGHCKVPRNFMTPDGVRLGSWVSQQKVKRDKLSMDRANLLASLPAWTWVFEDRFYERFEELKEFVNKHNHYKTAIGCKLGDWIVKQRMKMREGELSQDRISLFESLPGWSWDVNGDKWNNWFMLLKNFASTKGHCQVPKRHETKDGEKLGLWTLRQRNSKHKLELAQIALLEALPNWTWDILEDKWEEGFSELLEYCEENGSSRVPYSFITGSNYKLGAWVSTQRQSEITDTLSKYRKDRLEALPGWTWKPYEKLWEEGFSNLQKYCKKAGSSQVPQTYVTEADYKLGSWVSTQRRSKDEMSQERKELLEALPGWSWDAFSDRWEDGFRHLKEFSDQAGHTKIPQNHKTADGYRLGGWVSKQRKAKDNMSQERRARLEALPGWGWRA